MPAAFDDQTPAGAAPPFLAELAHYLPTFLVRRLSAAEAVAQPWLAPLHGAVLFTDITGFTSLTEQLQQHGSAGAETLSQLLNGYFAPLTAAIVQHGGDIIKFAGDAVVALWAAASPAELAQAALRAAQCALAIQALRAGTAAVTLSLRCGIGAGPLQLIHVGADGRWDMALLGAALDQAVAAEQQARADEIMLSAPVAQLLDVHVYSEPLAGLDVRRLAAVSTPLPPLAQPEPALPPSASVALRAYVPDIVFSRLAANQTGYLSELRLVSVLFVQLPAVDASAAAAMLNAIQTLAATVQTTLQRFEGTLNKVSVDDKGAAIVAAFGLPPYAHEDDALRAVLAALDIQQHLRDQGLPVAIGVATGRAFCGIIGGAARREYTLIGDTVNLAARLMQASAQRDVPVICDEATYQATLGRVVFQVLPALHVKGRSAPLSAFAPQSGHAAPRKPQPAAARQLVGRSSELAALTAALQRLRLGHGGIAVIEGEAGLGKSRLVEAVQAQAHAHELRVLVGSSDSVEQNTPYHSWREVIEHVLELDPLSEPAAQRNQLEHVLGPELLPHAPLLRSILRLELADNAQTRPMSDQLRAENLRALLVAIIERAAAQPMLLILEDVHWMDSASWALAAEIGRRPNPILLLLVTRPLSDAPPSAYGELAALPQTLHLRLQPLAADAIQALVAQSLGVAQIPASVEALIRSKAEGNPFYSEEIAYALRDTGILQISAGECRLSPGIDLSQISFPDTLQGVVASRIDKLPPQQQLALKVASVIGRVFSLRVLNAIYPVADDKPYLADYLDLLQRLDLTPRDFSALELQYMFKHAITQEVVYNFLLFAQRRELHRLIAEWYEHNVADLGPLFPLLAHHWSRVVEAGQDDAEARQKALAYLTNAGLQALQTSAFREARTFFEQALALIPATAVTLERMQLYNHLGETYFQLSDYAAAQEHLQQSLMLARQLDDLPGKVNALSNLGRVGWQVGTYAEAEAYLEEGLELATELQDLTGVVHILKNLGVVAYYRGQNIQAEFYFERGLQLARELGEPVLIGSLLNNVGNTARMAGNLERARELYLEGVDVCRRYNVHWVLAMLLGNLALVEQLAGNLQAAQDYHGQSLRLHLRNGNQWGIAIVKREMGMVADELGDSVAAQQHFIEGLHIALEISALPKALSNLAGLSRLYSHTGHAALAAALVGFIEAHPATDSEAVRILKPVVESLRAQLGPAYAQHIQRGETYAFPAITAAVAAVSFASTQQPRA